MDKHDQNTTPGDLRKQLGLSVVQVAAAAGTGVGTVYAIERGEAPGRTKTLLGLAAALQVGPEELLAAIEAADRDRTAARKAG